MQRETTNVIRTILEDWIPPVIRDTGLFRFCFRLAYGDTIDQMADFRKRAAFHTAKDYEEFYRTAIRLHDQTDNSRGVLSEISRHCLNGTVIDVGCGKGHTLRYLAEQGSKENTEFWGVDLALPTKLDRSAGNIHLREGDIAHLEFPDAHFDTVICTHVLEHVLDFRAALAELRRVSKKRLIIVVPREREYVYNFNPHFHFFPYEHSLLRHLFPIPETFEVKSIGRDLFYYEDRN